MISFNYIPVVGHAMRLHTFEIEDTKEAIRLSTKKTTNKNKNKTE